MLRLKEKPSEWIKFTAVIGLAINVFLWMLWWRGRLGLALPVTAACIASVAAITALIVPRWFRGFYRAGMTVSFHIGQIIGKVLLTVFFFLVVTPLGLLLRLMRKDLLQIKREKTAKSWWHTSKSNREFDRMF